MMEIDSSQWRRDVVVSLPVANRAIPLMLSPATSRSEWLPWLRENATSIRELLVKHGALLFRDFGVRNTAQFEAFVSTICGLPLPYYERSSPRTLVAGNVYTSTDYPREQAIPLHNEQSYNASFPMFIAFHCVEPPGAGGETPIADCRRVFERIPGDIRERLVRDGYLYVRNFHSGVGLPWSEVFQTSDRDVVDAYCLKNGISVDWNSGAGGVLRTKQLRRVAGLHPSTGEATWMNHVVFFHYSSLPKAVGDYLVRCYSEDGLPNNTLFGSGERMTSQVLDVLRDVYNKETVVFGWELGDVLVLDNMLAAHGRRPFTGSRRILTAMAGVRRWNDVPQVYCGQ